MCGIIGMMSAKSGFFSAEKDQFKQMLLLTSLRGAHSTGLVGIDTAEKKNSDVAIIKSIGNPYDLFNYSKSDKFFSKMVTEYDMVVGHCRYATRGEVNAINAHPFREDHITLVHNGMISNFSYLHDSKKHADIEVDSHLIARLIADDGAEEVLPKISGPFTFVWYDSNTHRLCIARNKERPLWFGRHKNREVLSFASEGETLMWNATRNKSPMTDVFECEPFQILEFAAGSLEPVEVKEFKPRVTYNAWPTKSNDNFSEYADFDYPHGRTYIPEKPKEVERKSYKEKRTYRLNESEEVDNLTFERTEETHFVEVGQEVEFVVDDFKEIAKHDTKEYLTTCIWGDSGAFPNVQFMCNSKQVDVDELFECVGIRAIVSSIVKVPPEATPNHVQWRVYVNNFIILHAPDSTVKPKAKGKKYKEVVQKELSLDDLVSVGTFTEGKKEIMTKDKFTQLCDGTCALCYNMISDKQRAYPDNLLYIEDSGNGDGIICEDCAKGWIGIDNTQEVGQEAKQ